MSERIGRYISMIHRQEQRFICSQMKEYGLGFPDYIFLLGIYNHEGCMQKELSRLHGVDDALSTRCAQKLEKKGYLIRKKSKDDRRVFCLYLTDAGRELIPKLDRALSDWQTVLTQGMTDSEKEYLIKILKHTALLAREINGLDITSWENRKEDNAK